MTSAERNEVRRIAQASLDAHANCRRSTDGPCTCGDCAGWRAILRYVPTENTPRAVDSAVTIAGLEARVKSFSEACRALGADCVESIAQANSARASVAAVTVERDALAVQLTEARAELARKAEDGDALALRADLASVRADLERLKAELHRSQRDEREIREALATVANGLDCGHSAEAVVAAVVRLTAERDQARADDRQSVSTWLRLLKAIDPTAENTDDALQAVARLTAQLEEARIDLSLTKATSDQLKERCNVLTTHVTKLEAADAAEES